MSLVVKGFALVFVLTLDKQNAINFQLLGGIWIMQSFPAVVFCLYTRWFHRTGLLLGWLVGIAVVATLVLNTTKVHNGSDVTRYGDYHADSDAPTVKADLEAVSTRRGSSASPAEP